MFEFCRDVRKQVFCTWAGILNASQTIIATVSTVWHACDGEAVEFSAREVLHERVLKLTKFAKRTRVPVLTCRSFKCVQLLSVRDSCQGSGNVWLQKKKNSNLLRKTHCANQWARVGEMWVVKVRKMMGTLNVGCRSCCGSDLFVVRYLKLFFLRRKGDGCGSSLSVLRCSPMLSLFIPRFGCSDCL